MSKLPMGNFIKHQKVQIKAGYLFIFYYDSTRSVSKNNLWPFQGLIRWTTHPSLASACVYLYNHSGNHFFWNIYQEPWNIHTLWLRNALLGINPKEIIRDLTKDARRLIILLFVIVIYVYNRWNTQQKSISKENMTYPSHGFFNNY